MHGKMIFLNSLKIFRTVFFPGKGKSHTVKLINNQLICSCNESVFEGLPCRHELSVCIKVNISFDSLQIAKRWTKEFFKIENLPKDDEEEDYKNEDEDQAEADDSYDEDEEEKDVYDENKYSYDEDEEEKEKYVSEIVKF